MKWNLKQILAKVEEASDADGRSLVGGFSTSYTAALSPGVGSEVSNNCYGNNCAFGCGVNVGCGHNSTAGCGQN